MLHIVYFSKRIYIVFDKCLYALQARKIDGLKLLKVWWI